MTVASISPESGGDSTKTIFSIGLDKFQHFFAFALIMFLSIGAFRKPTNRRIALAALCVMLFGVAIETIQAFLPSRTFNPLDIASNSAGIFAIIIGWWLFKRMKDAE